MRNVAHDTRMELTNGYNIQKRSVLGHEPWLVIFCWNNARQADVDKFFARHLAEVQR